MKLADQIAIITGAGRNIGEETAKLFAAEGASIAVVDMDRGRADKVTGAIIAAGGKAKTYICDVSQEDQIIATVKRWLPIGAGSTFSSTMSRSPTTSTSSTSPKPSGPRLRDLPHRAHAVQPNMPPRR